LRSLFPTRRFPSPILPRFELGRSPEGGLRAKLELPAA
jgi:hypothetical protein